MVFKKLSDLKIGENAVIYKISEPRHADEARLLHRLHEVGFNEGRCIRVAHEAPLSKDPVAYQIGADCFAIHRINADQILVQVIQGQVS